MEIPIKLSKRNTINQEQLSSLRQLVGSWTHQQVVEPESADPQVYAAWGVEALELELDALQYLCRMRQKDLARLRQIASTGLDEE